MKTHDSCCNSLPSLAPKPVPNPRGTQTVPQPEPTTPRSPDGRFAPEFRPNPRQTSVVHPGKPSPTANLFFLRDRPRAATLRSRQPQRPRPRAEDISAEAHSHTEPASAAIEFVQSASAPSSISRMYSS